MATRISKQIIHMVQRKVFLDEMRYRKKDVAQVRNRMGREIVHSFNLILGEGERTDRFWEKHIRPRVKEKFGYAILSHKAISKHEMFYELQRITGVRFRHQKFIPLEVKDVLSMAPQAKAPPSCNADTYVGRLLWGTERLWLSANLGTSQRPGSTSNDTGRGIPQNERVSRTLILERLKLRLRLVRAIGGGEYDTRSNTRQVLKICDICETLGTNVADTIEVLRWLRKCRSIHSGGPNLLSVRIQFLWMTAFLQLSGFFLNLFLGGGGAKEREKDEGARAKESITDEVICELHTFLQPATPHLSRLRGFSILDREKWPEREREKHIQISSMALKRALEMYIDGLDFLARLNNPEPRCHPLAKRATSALGTALLQFASDLLEKGEPMKRFLFIRQATWASRRAAEILPFKSSKVPLFIN